MVRSGPEPARTDAGGPAAFPAGRPRALSAFLADGRRALSAFLAGRRRALSVPERVGAFGLVVAGAAAVWPAITERTGAGLPCPLRALTGVPCPACGLTTAAVALARGDVLTAYASNPLILALAALAAAVVPLVALRAAGVLPPPRPWPPSRRRRAERLSYLLAAASWLYQLHRLGFGRAV